MTESEDRYILAGTKEDQEQRRLELVQADYDFYSQARLLSLGLAAGATCLEAGVGVGSMARWMKAQVGEGGSVVGLDLSDRYFALSDGVGLDLRLGDIRTLELPEASFDFIHARCFLMHVPGTEAILSRFLRWLKPGGWVVLCDWDFSFHHRVTGSGAFYNEVVDEVVEVIASYGGNSKVGMELPYLLADAGFSDIDAAGTFPLVLPWGNQPEFLPLSIEAVRPLLRMDEEREREHEAFLESVPGSMQTGHVLVMSWARRPVTQLNQDS